MAVHRQAVLAHLVITRLDVSITMTHDRNMNDYPDFSRYLLFLFFIHVEELKQVFFLFFCKE